MYVQWLASTLRGVEKPPRCSFSLFQFSRYSYFPPWNTLSSIAFVPSHPLVLLCFSIVKMSPTTSSCSRFRVGAIVFVKASQVLSAGDLGRLFGSKAPKMYLPGLVTHCEIRESSGGRHLRYMTCRFFLGGVQEKIKEVGIQCTKIRPPDGCFYPERILAYDIDTHLSQTTLEA